MEMLQEAINLYEQGQLNKAEDILDYLKNEDNKNPEVFYYLGCISLEKDEYEKAIDYLEKSIKIDNSQAKSYEKLGEALGLKSRKVNILKAARTVGKVKNAFQKALELDPQNLGAREGLFTLYLFAPPMAGGDPEKADALMAEIEAINPAHGLIARAMKLLKEQNLPEVDRTFVKAAELGKDDADIQMRVARYFMDRKDFRKALNSIDQFIQLKPEDPSGYLTKGEILSKMNRDDEALENFSKAIEKDAQNLRAHYQRALHYHFQQKNDLAKQDLKFIIEQGGKHPLRDRAKKLLKEIK
ncbi:hypothetical protein DRI50_03950 [candidate division KSB1 bacterium]|nr:MAG: hypothetical protein DRI50_03950 [candidate division KSB1 bacterium]